MTRNIKWSIHRDDDKIGKIESVDDLTADRFVSTGMAVYVDDEAASAADSDDDQGAEKTADAEPVADKTAPASARRTPGAPAAGSAQAAKNPTDASEVVSKG